MKNKIIIVYSFDEFKYIDKIYKNLGIIFNSNIDEYEDFNYPLSIIKIKSEVYSICANCLFCYPIHPHCFHMKNKEIITFTQFTREEKLNRILND